MARHEYITRGIKKQEEEAGRGERLRLPITPAILHMLKAVWDNTGGQHDTKML